ncbi:hypothetical protein [Paenibacillus sp. NPDC058071]|uniref:hypothetical protein n=1 Tax=Paenibacillus sp. NPDC058071 TaxID=3346326 RepID=UPI0036DD2E47
MSTKLRICIVVITIFTVLPLILLTACKSDAGRLPLKQETAHAGFYSPNDNSNESVASLAEVFEENYERLADLFRYTAEDKTIVHVYTDRNAFRKMIGRDTEGTYDGRDRMIKVYTPADLSDEGVKRHYNEQLVHEFVHQIIQQLSPDVGKVKWLDEGTAYYASGQLEEEMQRKTAYYDIPTLQQFADPGYFDQEGGAAYFYSGLVVKYIADTYGVDTLNEIIRQPDLEHVEQILKMSIDRFFDAWHDTMLNN